MTKPFDTAVLLAKLSSKGLDIAEETLKMVLIETFDWANESAKIHENPIVQAGVPLATATLKPVLLVQIDKIDGQVG